MTNVLPKAAHKEDLTVRGLRQSDLPAADSTAIGVRHLHRCDFVVGTRIMSTPAGWLTRVGPSPPSATGGWWGRTS
jgi:hypothetical protein